MSKDEWLVRWVFGTVREPWVRIASDPFLVDIILRNVLARGLLSEINVGSVQLCTLVLIKPSLGVLRLLLGPIALAVGLKAAVCGLLTHEIGTEAEGQFCGHNETVLL